MLLPVTLPPNLPVETATDLAEAVVLSGVTSTHFPILEMQANPALAMLKPFNFLINFYLYKLEEGLAGLGLAVEEETLKASLLETLLYRLSGLTGRTLALELGLTRLAGELTGATPAVRFDNFLEDLAANGPLGGLTLLQNYPGLAQLLTRAGRTWLDSSLEMLRRLTQDLPLLAETFSELAATQLATVQGGLSDAHCGGRSVLILTFANGAKLVYKPRDLTIEANFQELLTWLNSQAPQTGELPLTFQTWQVVKRDGYGWVEFIPAQACSEMAGVRRFYRRLGNYLALFYLTGATDLHYENLIACGEQPIPIDLETLFQPSLVTGTDESPITENAYDRALRLQQNSVLRTGLLPNRSFAKAGSSGIDISGLGSSSEQLLPGRYLTPIAFGTDEWRFDRQTVKLVMTQAHRPSLAGQTFAPQAFIPELLAGFSQLYRLVLAKRHEFAQVLKGLFVGTAVRVIVRPTRTYALLLAESSHPDLLREPEALANWFGQLDLAVATRPVLAHFLPHEQFDLLAGDIPYFTASVSERAVYNSRGALVGDLCYEAALAATLRKVTTEISEADLLRQIWFIRAAFASNFSGQSADRPFSPPKIPAKSELATFQLPASTLQAGWFATALRVGEKLTQTAIFDESHTSAVWGDVTLVDEGRLWLPTVSHLDLYGGLPGIGLFLAYLGKLSGQARFTRLAEQVLASCQELQARLTKQKQLDRLPTGAFNGIGGLIYYYSQLGRLWQQPALIAKALALSQFLAERFENQTAKLDILAGAAGNILVLSELARLTGEAQPLELARRYGEQLLAQAQTQAGGGVAWEGYIPASQPLTGFSHGVAGIAYALLELAQVTGDPTFRETALAGIAYERRVFSAIAQNWPDFRTLPNYNSDEKPAASTEMIAWCHGATGIGLARLTSLRREHLTGLTASQVQSFRAEVEIALNTTCEQGFGFNHSLCHGDLGNAELLLQAVQSGEFGAVAERFNVVQTKLLSELAGSSIFRTGLPGELSLETPGLLTGLAGIGYGCLRLAFPASVPAVLLLESAGG